MNRFPETDPYLVLGLPRGCSSFDIRTAYRKLALKNHPDRAPPAEKEAATQRFKVIGEAYEFLSDDRKRREYDNFGPGATFAPTEEYEDDLTRKHFGTSPDGVPFSFMWESSADSARRAQAGRRMGRPFGADGLDPFELFNMMFSKEFGSGMAGAGSMGGAEGLGRMNAGGAAMGGSVFGESNPFMQNHRMMADTAGFGFGGPFASRGSPAGMGMQGGPFGMGMSSSSSSTSTSTTYGGFSGTSESTTTRIVNGRKETVTRKVDEHGNVTVHSRTPEGSTVTVNGVQQAQHPLLGNMGASASGALPGTASNPIVVDESEPMTSQTQTQAPFGTGGFH